MDLKLQNKERTYRDVFKGSVLVTTLMDHDNENFPTRSSATRFAQRLLDNGHIVSIVGRATFEDSLHLYRWKDESLVRDARKYAMHYDNNIIRFAFIK